MHRHGGRTGKRLCLSSRKARNSLKHKDWQEMCPAPEQAMALKAAQAPRIFPSLPQPCLCHDSSSKGMKSHFCPVS